MRLGYSLALTLLLPACHANTAPAAPPAAARALVTDGVVDIGGLALHLHCVGQGEPTVVLEAGLGNDGTVWRAVQAEVGRVSRACAYDRAGLGYSSPAPTPHTNRQMARELHTLLARAGLAAPYVLVGHSMGGLNVRLFEAEHPGEVVGMVLVDATVDPVRARSLVPDEELQKFKAMLPQIGEGVDFESFAAGAADARASSRSLSGKPLVVLTRSVEDPQPWASAEQLAQMLKLWQDQQAELPKLSSNSVHIVAPGSHHYIQVDAPRLVVTAITEVVKTARTRGQLNQAVFAPFSHPSAAPVGN